MVTKASTLKTPVSLRLPSDITEAVAAYASKHGLTKTDAYEYFLRLAISNSQSTNNDADFTELARKIDAVFDLLTNQSSSANSTAKANERANVINTIADVARQFPAIKKAVLFGSFARNEFTPESDIDVRLELDRNKKFNLRDLALFSKQIEQKTGRSVDVISKDNIENARLKAAIETEGISVYERQEQ